MIFRLNRLKIKQLTNASTSTWIKIGSYINCVWIVIKQLFFSVLVRYKFYMWSDRVMREVVRYGWKTAHGRRNKPVNMIVTPAVQVSRPSLLCKISLLHQYTEYPVYCNQGSIFFSCTPKKYYYQFIRFHCIVSNAFALIDFNQIF